MPNPNAFVVVNACGITGPEEGLTLSADCTLWGANYPTDEIGGGATVLVNPLPALAANYKSAMTAAIVANFSGYHILRVIYPGFDIVVVNLI